MMGYLQYDKDGEAGMRAVLREKFATFERLRYKIKCIAGDYYYEKMSVEETYEKCFIGPESEDKVLRNLNDINEYIRDNINEKLPLDGPLWRMYFQKYEPASNVGKPPEEQTKFIVIWKNHHSFGDGISVTCMQLFISQEFDSSYFMKVPQLSKFKAVLIRMMTPFYLPLILMESVLSPRDTNCLMKNKQNLSGKMNV